MATYVARGFTTATNNLTPHSSYAITRGDSLLAIPDGVYRPGDIVPLSISSATTLGTFFVGYVQGTNNPILLRDGTIQYVVLFADGTDPGGNSYDPGDASSIVTEPLGVGPPIVFADVGFRQTGSTNFSYTSQDKEIEFDRGVLEVSGTVTLRTYTVSGGTRTLDQTFDATFLGRDSETGDLIFDPPSNINGGRNIVAASVKQSTYQILTNDIVAEAWPPDVTYTNYGIRQGDALADGDPFTLQGTSPGFVALDVPDGVHRVGDMLEIRVFGGVGGGESVEVEYVGFYNKSNYQYPIFEAANFEGRRTQFIGTRELNTDATYAPHFAANLSTQPLGIGVARFADYGLRIPEGDGDTNNLNSQDREIEFDYESLTVNENVELRIFRVRNGVRDTEPQLTLNARYAGFDRETGDPIFSHPEEDDQPWRGQRQIIAASVKQTTYEVPHGDDVDDMDNTVEDRTGGDIIAESWPPRDIDDTFSNYGFRQGANLENEAFALQGEGPTFGIHVPPGIYKAGNSYDIELHGGTANGAVTVTFVGYVTNLPGTSFETEYPIFEHADFRGNGRAQFIGTNQLHETATYMVASGDITDDEPLGIGDATFGAWGITQDPQNLDEFDITNTEITIAYDVYEVNDMVMYQITGGSPQMATYLGYEEGSGFPVFQMTNQAGVTQRIIMLDSTADRDYTLSGDIVQNDWPAETLVSEFSNYGFRQREDGELADVDFDLLGAGIDIEQGVHNVGDTVHIRFFGGETDVASGGSRGIAGFNVPTTYLGHVVGPDGQLYPVFEHPNFRGAGKAQFIGTDHPRETTTTYEAYEANELVTNQPLAIGISSFSNFAIRQGATIEGTYQFLGEGRTIPDGTYMVGDRTKNGETLMLADQDNDNQAVEFVGYQAETFYPVFRSINQVNGEFINFLLTNEPTTSPNISLTSDTLITDMPYTTCFAPGTWIATPDGERLVETLKPGDKVLTAESCVANVKWVGVQKVPTMFGAREVTWPVRIMAGALDDNVPHTDLVVTRDHGMIVDGVICHAGALINGTSIIEVSPDELGTDQHGVATYYHVETENHVPLLANGAAAESFIDNVERSVFDNHSEFVTLYGSSVPAMTEMTLPRAMSARQLPRRITLLLDERAAMILPSVARRA